MDMCLPGSAPIAFGRYAFDPWRGELRAAGARPVVLGACAARVLRALIEAAGHVLTPAQLIELAWPGRVIHASNLRVQIAALRRVLAGDRGLIGTVAGQGYVFTGQVTGAPALPPLPALVGRAALVEAVARRCADAPIVTLTGPAGVGKSALALAVAHRLRGMPRRFVDFDAAHSLATLTPVALGEGPLLLVLDNCDHRIDAVSRLAEGLIRHLPALRILATGRQTLRADGETVVRVPPLGRSHAVQLFTSSAFGNVADGPGLAAVEQLCDRLDGMPLALMLAAQQVRRGADALRALADPGTDLAALSGEAPLARHRSLSASLAWDSALLPAPAGTALAALRGFPSWFALANAAALLPAYGIAAADVVDCLATLAAHSLLVADTAATPARYRLLATSRV
jgi:predicted ATPase/DNA-binding winged helix-turn-helix (wHTH) protein